MNLISKYKNEINKMIGVLLWLGLIISLLRINSLVFPFELINIIYKVDILLLFPLLIIYISIMKNKLHVEHYLLVLFYLFLLFTTLYNQYTFNRLSITYLIDTFFYIFAGFIYFSVEKNERLVKFYIKSFAIISTLYASVAILVYFTGISIHWLNGYVIEQVYSSSYQNRIMNILRQPNQGAVYSVISILLSLYLYRESNKKVTYKLLLVYSLIINVLVVILSDSRVSLLAIIILAISVVIFTSKKTKITDRIFALSVFAIVILNKIFDGYINADNKKRSIQDVLTMYKEENDISNSISEPLPSTTPVTNTPTPEIADNQVLEQSSNVISQNVGKLTIIEKIENSNLYKIANTLTTGRVSLWMDTLKINKGINILIGNGINCFQQLENTVLGRNIYFNNAHCILFDLYINCGLIGMVLFLGFVVVILKKLLTNISIIITSNKKYLVMLCLFIFIFSLMDCAVLFLQQTYNILFWVLLGYLCNKSYD